MIGVFLRIFDIVFMLGLGTKNRLRFDLYAARSKPSTEGDSRINIDAVTTWRAMQQQEWDRLSTMLVLLATASAAMLAVQQLSTDSNGSQIQVPAPHLAFALWMAAAGLSICGTFILQYFAIWALSIGHEDMTDLAALGSEPSHIYAMVVATPVVMALWSSVMFILGIVVYAVTVNLGGAFFTSVVMIPLGCGMVVAVGIVILGELISIHCKKPDVVPTVHGHEHQTMLLTHATPSEAHSMMKSGDSELSMQTLKNSDPLASIGQIEVASRLTDRNATSSA